MSDIIQDRRGFIWIATDNGLNRFDGRTFTVLTKEKDGLQDNKIYSLLEDSFGQIWIFYGEPESFGMITGADILNPVTNEVSHFSAKSDYPSFSFHKVKPIQSGEKIFFITASNALFLYDSTLQKLAYQPQKQVHYIIENHRGNFWIGEDNMLLEVDIFGQVLQRDTFQLPVSYLYEKPDSTLWIRELEVIQRDSIFHVQLYTKTAQKKPVKHLLPKETLRRITLRLYQDQYQYTWFYHRDILIVFDEQDNEAADFTHALRDDYFSTGINCLFIDRNGVAWVGTFNGLFKITLKRNLFRQYLQRVDDRFSTRGIMQRGRHLYAQTYSGFWRIDLQTGKEQLLNQFPPTGRGIEMDQQGNFWLHPYAREMLKFSQSASAPVLYSPSKDTLPDFFTTNISFLDKEGTRWVGTNYGLFYVDSLSKTIIPFTKYNRFTDLRSSPVKHIHENESGLWLATGTGIYLVDKQQGVLDVFNTQTKKLPFSDVNHIAETEGGTFWVATTGQGLVKWNPEKVNQNPDVENYQQFTVNDGLSNNLLYAVYPDSYGYLWLPSDRGLMRFDTNSHFVNTFLLQDGIAHEEFNRWSHYRSASDSFYFGGLNGITAFYPKDFVGHNKDRSSSLQITRFQYTDVNSGDLIDATTDLLTSKQIILHPGEKTFILEYALLDYQNPEKNYYAYQIEGWDKKWTYTKDNTLRINGLSYGTYTLKIKGYGPGAQGTSQELAIPIIVQKPFYLKYGFLGSMLLLLILSIWIAFRQRITYLRRSKKLLEERVKSRTKHLEEAKQTIEKQATELIQLDELKSRFFANMAHELRTPLTMILAPLKRLLGETKLENQTFTTLKLIQKNTHELQRLIEEILDMDKLDAQKLSLKEETVAFYPLMRRLVSTFESHAQSNEIELHFTYHAESYLNLKLDINKFEHIIFNLLSNALKFTFRGGKVVVHVEDNQRHIQVSVSDTGCGIHPDDLPYIFNRFYQARNHNNQVEGGTGIGLALAFEYSQLMKGTLKAESKLDEGSTFVFAFPKQEVFAGTIQPLPEDEAFFPKKESTILPEVESTIPVLRQSQTKKITVSSNPQKPSVLVVEDNSDMRRFIQETLETKYDVKTAQNGVHALELLEKWTKEGEVSLLPQIIITDIMMPQMDGFTLVQTLKSEPKWQTIPIIVLTAKASLSDRLVALRAGIDDYLTKPFETEELLARTENLISNHQERLNWLKKQKFTIAEGENPASLHLEELQSEEILSADIIWLEKVENIAFQEIERDSFNAEDLAHQLALSSRQLRRKLKAMTGMSPSEYLREVRLQKARQLLENKAHSTVAQVCYSVGLADTQHFGKLFRNRFGKNPSEYFSAN